MPSREWRFRLEDILEAIGKIERFTAGMDFESFRADDKTADAVIRNIEIIGEAARNVPPEIQEHHTDIPWGKMRAMRNVLMHEYFGVSLSQVWQTLKEDLPPLTSQIRAVLDHEQNVD